MARPAAQFAAVLLAQAACSGGSTIPIGNGSCTTCQHHDGGASDAGKQGGSKDGGPDGGAADAGAPDAGPDGGPTDAGSDGGGIDSGLPLIGDVCPANSIPFSGEVLDLCATEAMGTDIPLDGVQVATLAPYSAVMTDDGGTYTLCLPPGVPTTMVFSDPDYVTLYMPEVIVTQGSVPIGTSIGRVRLPCAAGIQGYASELPGLNPALPLVYAQIDSVSNVPPCGGKTDGGSPFAGWVFLASLADDGGIGDGGIVNGGLWPVGYLDSSDDLQAVSSTFSTGEGVIFNIDAAADYIVVEASNRSLDKVCPSLDAALGFDGRIHVASNSVSVYPWIVP